MEEEIQRPLWQKILAALVALLILGGMAFGAYKIYKYVKGRGIDKIVENVFNPGPLQGPTRSTRAKNLDPDKIIEWTNYYRNQENLPSLAENSKLDAAALKKAEDMFARQYFEHTSPTGESASDLVLAQGYNYKIVGENLALGDFSDEKDLVDAWMASPGHRANIMKADYKDIGVASKLSTYKDRITWISVQEFGASAPNCTTPSTSTKTQIDQNKSQISQNNDQINALNSQGNYLVQQGNAKIEQGNQVYTETGDKSQAQPYWDEGKSLQNQGQAKLDQAKRIEDQNKSLENQTQDLINQYNADVEDYNNCIKS